MSSKKGLCLILEGGGAKCAYEFGVLKALAKANYKYKGIGGTSFGSLNGALYLENGIKALDSFWTNLSPANIFKEEKLNDFMEKIYSKENVFNKEALDFVVEQWKLGSLSYDKISTQYQDWVKKSVNEKKIRKSKIDFGFVIVELPKMSKVLVKSASKILEKVSEKFLKKENSESENPIEFLDLKPVNIYLENVPLGQLPDYILASSSIPVFKPVKIDENYYIDGGVCDNVPIKAMYNLGYRDFIVVRVNPDEYNDIPSDANIKFISPKTNLGSSGMFATSNVQKLIKLGYDDGLAFVNRDKKNSLLWKIKKLFIKNEL
jgi:NTE family protein